jgi:peptide deformylase
MVREILTYPNKTLRKKSEPVLLDDFCNKDFKKLVVDLKETMLAKDGLGLAAPQINQLRRVVAINTKDGVLVLVNPKIKTFSWRKKVDEEGCLSVPGVFGNVRRALKIKLDAYNEVGDKLEMEATGLLARVVQHEVDHLDAILFIDKVIPNKKKNKQL